MSCTTCFPAQPVSGAEQEALKELEKEYVGLQRKKVGFDNGSLSNLHAV